MTDNGSTLYIIDDRDTTRLTYHGSWFTTTDTEDYHSTATGTTTAGSFVRFVFNGTFVSAFGTVGSTGSNSSYTLDDLMPVHVSRARPSSPIYNELFYVSPILPAGEHTLTINASSDGDYFWLDYLRFTALSNETQTDVPSFQLTPSVRPDTSARSQAPSSGAICGIVMGVVALLVIVFGVLLYVCGWCSCLRRCKAPTPVRHVDFVMEDLACPPPVMDIFKFRKIAARRGPRASCSHSSSSRPTDSSAMFTSVIFLTPPVSEASGGPAEPNQRAQIPALPSARPCATSTG